MVLLFSLSMTRKLLALLIVVIASGLAPATAVMGFCAKMPCCFGEAEESPVLAVHMADCCTTISCFEAPSHDLTVSVKAKLFGAITSAITPVRVAIPQVSVVRRTFSDDTSPPAPMGKRLSALSIFLI